MMNSMLLKPDAPFPSRGDMNMNASVPSSAVIEIRYNSPAAELFEQLEETWVRQFFRIQDTGDNFRACQVDTHPDDRSFDPVAHQWLSAVWSLIELRAEVPHSDTDLDNKRNDDLFRNIAYALHHLADVV
jgi:hypothetical protein